RPERGQQRRTGEALPGPREALVGRRGVAVGEVCRAVQEVFEEVRAAGGRSGDDHSRQVTAATWYHGCMSRIRFDVLCLFPGIFEGFLGESILKLAQDRGLVEIHRWNIRDWSTDEKHHKVDDRPFGGGPGMILMPEPVVAAVEAVQAKAEPGLLVLLTPS